MILLTHNMLRSPMQAAQSKLPLKIEPKEVQVKEREFNAELLANLLPKLDWQALVEGAAALGLEGLPAQVSDVDTENDEQMQRLHRILLETAVVSGELVDVETKRRFPITNGTPNMLLDAGE